MQLQKSPPSLETFSDRFQHIRFLSEEDSVPRTTARPPALGPTRARRFTAAFRPPRPTTAPGDPQAERFLAWILDRAGVNPTHYRTAPLARRLHACFRALRVRSVSEARQRLEREPERLAQAANALLIGVTDFFRDPDVFRYLEETILPQLAAQGRGLRVWSAACADGAELYSVAMLLADSGLLSSSTLLGTDCRADAIRQAQRGWFEVGRLEGLNADLRQRYFTAGGNGGRINAPLRHTVRWEQSDVLFACDTREQPWDLILCRNLAIYLERAACTALWARLAAALRSGGVLVVGKAERPEAPCGLVRQAPCVFEKRR